MRDPDLQESGRSSDSRSETASSPEASMIERLARLQGDATRLGAAHRALAKAAGRASVEGVEREFSDLFS
jgi:hypothetical protein